MKRTNLGNPCFSYEHSPSPNLRRASVENPFVEHPKENKDHKNVYKLQLKNKLEHYRFFRLPHHGNRSLVFYRLTCSGGEVTSWSGGIQRRSPQPPLFHKECVYRDLKSSQHRLKQKSSKKRPGYRSPMNSLEQVIPLWKSFCKYSSPGARVGLV